MVLLELECAELVKGKVRVLKLKLLMKCSSEMTTKKRMASLDLECPSLAKRWGCRGSDEEGSRLRSSQEVLNTL